MAKAKRGSKKGRAPSTPKAQTKRNDTVETTKKGRYWKLFRIGAIVAVLALVAGIVGNVEKISGPILSTGTFLGNQTVAAALTIDTVREWFGRRLLARAHEEVFVCFGDVHPFDLDGDGVKSDLVIVFKRTATVEGHCSRADLAPDDVAFFRLSWNGFQYVGETDFPNDVAFWDFAGPAAFRVAMNSSHPDVEVFMYRDGNIANVGNIGTVSATEYVTPELFESSDGKAAWIITVASVSKVGFGPDGKPFVRTLDGKSLVAENRGLHLLSYDGNGKLTFDGESSGIEPDWSGMQQSTEKMATPDVSSPHDGDKFQIIMSTGSQLYLVGCEPDTGLTRSENSSGAYIVDLNKNPAVWCALGEDTHFSVRIVAKDHL